MDEIVANLDKFTRRAVKHYWSTRKRQETRQIKSGRSDQGSRGAVTGGAQMNGFIELFTQVIHKAGIAESSIFTKKALELPGYFRPTKEWDILVVKNDKLVAAIEAKSQAGPSFGNNFNNRTEEAIGSAVDLWTAYREGAYSASPQPFIGYFFMLENCQASNRSVRVKEPHFKVFREFEDSSYLKRYEILCRKLILERHYTAAAFITSRKEEGLRGDYRTPSEDLSLYKFVKILTAHIKSL